jgi:hypothetical protein
VFFVSGINLVTFLMSSRLLQGIQDASRNKDQTACDAAAAQLQQLCLEAACSKVRCTALFVDCDNLAAAAELPC